MTCFDDNKTRKSSHFRSQSHTPSTEDTVQRRFDKSLDMIRKAKNVEVANNSVQLKHSLTREFESKLTALNQSFEQEKLFQKVELDRIRRELSRKIRQISKLQEIIEEQESFITILRLKAENLLFSPSIRSESPLKHAKAHSDSAVELKVEVDLAKAHVDSLQQVVEGYRKELDTKTNKCNLLESQIAQIKINFEQEKNNLISEMTVKENVHKKEKIALSEQLKSLKSEADRETAAHEEIQNRLQSAISGLQEELKTAKLLLTHPRLRAKVVTRLKDVENMIPDFEVKAVSVPTSATPGARSGRGRKWGRSLYGTQTVKVWNHLEHKSYMQGMEMERAASTKRERAGSVYHNSTATIESYRGSV